MRAASEQLESVTLAKIGKYYYFLEMHSGNIIVSIFSWYRSSLRPRFMDLSTNLGDSVPQARREMF